MSENQPLKRVVRMEESPFAYWGKTYQTEGEMYPYPAICHMLDTAAVAYEYLSLDQYFLDYSCSCILSPPSLLNRSLKDLVDLVKKVLSFFASLHDIGKISPHFQAKQYKLCSDLLTQEEKSAAAGSFKHGDFAYLITKEIEEMFVPSRREHPFSPTRKESLISILFRAATYHHGSIVIERQKYYERYIWKERRKAIVETLRDVLGVDDNDVALISHALSLERVSFLYAFAGFVSFCDWIASSPFVFMGDGYKQDLKEHFNEARDRAKEAIETLGVRL